MSRCLGSLLLVAAASAAVGQALLPPVPPGSLERSGVTNEGSKAGKGPFRLGARDPYGCRAGCAANQGVCLPKAENAKEKMGESSEGESNQLQIEEGQWLQTAEGVAPAPKPATPQMFGVRAARRRLRAPPF